VPQSSVASEQAEIKTAAAAESSPRFAEVAVPVHVFQTFTYRLPDDLISSAIVGARIVVPLGKRLVTGYIVGLRDNFSEEEADETVIKDAEAVLDSVPVVTNELLAITKWVSDYYEAPWGEVIKASLPPGISPSIEQFVSITPLGLTKRDDPAFSLTSTHSRVLSAVAEVGSTNVELLSKQFGRSPTNLAIRRLESEGLINRVHQTGTSSVRQKQQKAVRLIDGSLEISTSKPTAAQKRLLEILKMTKSLSLQQLLAQANASASSVHTLVKKGFVEIFDQGLRRDPLSGESLPAIEKYKLTSHQTNVLSEIESALEKGTYAPFLLHGVTGSGKTEIYIRAMRTALSLGRSALMLVPEIALTPVFSRRLRAHFGDQVAIFHSSLSRGERFDEWTRVRNGAARVVIGTRSAVFAPIANLGLVVVDEEHESTYRQQDSPQYSGRDTAIVRAQKESAVVVLGSATPSLESFHNASSGKYRYLQLPFRIGNRPMATARLIDMREEFDRYKKPRVFSDELLQAIEETNARREQSIILLNRRGYSSFVLCRSCGETVECPNCDVTLTYHRVDRVIVCHYCNHREAAPSQCPNCEGKYIYYLGEGTEQIEELLKKKFPALRIARIDRDTTSRRRAFERNLHDFSLGELDMLVGTQMLAKGHDYPNVTLVGVVSVDAGLALPDFRSAERTFQLITQVAGRAGRGDRPGQVLIQTYHPHHYALRHASAQDYQAFYNEEIRHRQNHSYPPFVALASILVHGAEPKRVRTDATILRTELDKANTERVCRILGPAPAPLARLKGEFRFQLLVKARSRKRMRDVLDVAIKNSLEQGVNTRSINLDIDPVSIM
jgi:primosomal protein N' (replication factor Y)